jgi:hypothetical protein
MSPAGDELTNGDRQALVRVNLPGLFLIMAGVLNGLFGILLVNRGMQTFRMTAEEVREALPQENAAELEKHGISLRLFQHFAGGCFLAWGGLALVGSWFIFYGGVNLRSLNYYWLAVSGSVLAVVPGISPLGCLRVGEIIGIWALTVLLKPDVRTAFRG